ncbi:hypothetical protein MAPG_07434 [Magnaporthiopsis poae ATCC 64411]|uniref:Uncharacterized protein n=1 Tax=Magnaporthiopsis poae (strain ATCC 64411 / 73-15) TaxID=644358 RepID=A0A0C4E4N7_MAGP6|nr:hypothetical protein MAPG_07434 [Magnaporthiopsis poae ATCC 64411]
MVAVVESGTGQNVVPLHFPPLGPSPAILSKKENEKKKEEKKRKKKGDFFWDHLKCGVCTESPYKLWAVLAITMGEGELWLGLPCYNARDVELLHATDRLEPTYLSTLFPKRYGTRPATMSAHQTTSVSARCPPIRISQVVVGRR